jgi:hypothetical protein
LENVSRAHYDLKENNIWSHAKHPRGATLIMAMLGKFFFAVATGHIDINLEDFQVGKDWPEIAPRS